MTKFSKADRPYLITVAVVDMVLAAWGMVVGSTLLFILLMVVWFNMMAYAYHNLNRRVILFAFGVAFFTFLIGRELLEQYFREEPEYIFLPEINDHLHLSLTLALAGVWISFAYFNRGKLYVNAESRLSSQYIRVRNVSKTLFYIVLPFSLIYRLIIAYFVATSGYASYYTDFAENVSGNIYLSIFNKIDTMLSVLFCCFIATLPTKKEFKNVQIFYLIYLLLSLFGGQRGPFILGVLLMFIFYVYMQGLFPREVWFKKKYLNYSLIVLPFLASAGSFYNAWRFDKKLDEVGIFEGAKNFVYEQGVTGYVVKRAYMHESQIPEDVYLLQFTHSGLIAKVLGIPVYNGNTVEHATKGGSFAHAMGYVILGNEYLLGRGTGSSYVAELYYDTGYPGIFVGSCFFGFLFSLLYKAKSLFKRITIFIVVTQLLWACRSSYVGFIILLTMPAIIVVGIIMFLYSRKTKKVVFRLKQRS